jgi:hypothetical protein
MSNGEAAEIKTTIGSRPAHFYDEFGRLVPWHSRPVLVDRPFEYLLNRFDLRTIV